MCAMKKSEAIKLFGNEAGLAAALDISRSAVNQWGDDVPELRAYQIKEILAAKEASRDAVSDRQKAA